MCRVWSGGRATLHPSRGRAGFTLIELILVFAIIAVGLAIGFGSIRDNLPRYRLLGAAKGLSKDLTLLKNLATTTGRQTRLRLTGAAGDCEDLDTWGGSWALEIGDASQNSQSWDVLPADAGEEGTDEDQSQGTVDLGKDGNRQARFVCLQQWQALSGPGGDNAESVVFNARGYIDNPHDDFDVDSGAIELKLINLIAAADDIDDSVTVAITRAGHVRISSTLGGGGLDGTISTNTTSTR